MAATLGLTDYLALIFGLYMIAAAIGMLRQPQIVNAIMDGLKESHLLAFVMGVIVLSMGAAIVGVHNRWDGVLAFIVSLIGWAALIEGLLILAVHDIYIGLFARIRWTHGAVRIISALCILGGAALVVAALA